MKRIVTLVALITFVVPLAARADDLDRVATLASRIVDLQQTGTRLRERIDTETRIDRKLLLGAGAAGAFLGIAAPVGPVAAGGVLALFSAAAVLRARIYRDRGRLSSVGDEEFGDWIALGKILGTDGARRAVDAVRGEGNNDPRGAVSRALSAEAPAMAIGGGGARR